ncbi:MAG: magnesium transporter CorA [Lachnospiraceae bacterium]|nr:magnesium transporter CorA [Lachnospiraceae bacterium]
MFYKISDTLEPSTLEACMRSHKPYVAVMTSKEWTETKDSFMMGIDLDIEYDRIHTTKAEVNYDSLTGGFNIPDKTDIAELEHEFTFALDEKGVVFIDDHGYAEMLVEDIRLTRRWRIPSYERFLYDFLNRIVFGDLAYLGKHEDELALIEDAILEGRADNDTLVRVTEIRRELLRLRTHYEQLMDLGREFYENENNFFVEHNLRYFDMFTARVERLQDITAYLRDYSGQVRELYTSQIAVAQNNTMTVLTVVTTIFMPLTLIVGWYGMNFRHMPELESPMGYPVVILVSLTIVIASLIYFHKRKWL